MSTILITGGTGLVGTALSNSLIHLCHKVIILTRKKKESSNTNIQYAYWDIEKGIIEEGILALADYIVHLAGENVAEKRWTARRMEEILESRIMPGNCLIKALNDSPNKVKAVIAASAIGWYGPDNNNSAIGGFTEEIANYDDFLGNTCFAWEQSMSPINKMGIRLVTLRIGIVLSEKGGALKEFMKPLDFGVAATMGSGKQIVSWIHIDDLCRMIGFCIENEEIKGVFNAVSPNPVSNSLLVKTLKKASDKLLSINISIPSFFLKLLLGDMSIEILKSTRVSAQKIINAGYRFEYSIISEAIKQLVDKKNSVNTQ